MTTLLHSLNPSLSNFSDPDLPINATSSSNDGDIHHVAPTNTEEKRLPILIIPGFMSSGLEVVSSELEPKWAGTRLWLDLKRLGIASAREGSSSMGLHPHHGNAKSHWIQHMMFEPENRMHELKGIQVRAIPGLAGVDYLDNSSSFSKMVTYVFGPLIRTLKKHGYQPGVDLDAASYDWRLIPSELEEKDGYFTKTMEIVERLYQQNNQTPVVLLCHSMGCKVGHYFLNFCLQHRGQDWIDTYIHTYMPVGAPHLGASNTLRGLICGDKMGLDAFLSDNDAIRLARSWGSVFWLIPRKLPRGAPPCSYLRPTGRLSIKPIWPMDPYTMLPNHPSREIKLSIIFGKHVLTKTFLSQNGQVETATFSFATDPDQPTVEGREPYFHLMFLNPYTHKNNQQADCLIRCATCPIRACCVLPCENWFRCLVPQQYLVTKQLVSQAIDQSAIVATSGAIHLSDLFPAADNNSNSQPRTATEQIQFQYGPVQRLATIGKPRINAITMEIQWEPFVKDSELPPLAKVIAEVHPDTTDTFAAEPYQPARPHRMAREEGGAKSAAELVRGMEQDPFDPRGRSAVEAPPVGRVKAIYGINLPTEVGACYTTRPAKVICSSDKKSIYVLDERAQLSQDAKQNGYRMKSGILEETKDTRQQVIRNTEDGSLEERKCSGDGTVPYWSLQHSKSWQSERCQVEVNELDKADHREILADERFHKIVVEYCVTPSSLSVQSAYRRSRVPTVSRK